MNLEEKMIKLTLSSHLELHKRSAFVPLGEGEVANEETESGSE